MYYWQEDRTVGPANPGHGFANALFCSNTKAARDARLEFVQIYDFSAKELTRAEALKFGQKSKMGIYAISHEHDGHGYYLKVFAEGERWGREIGKKYHRSEI